MDFATQIFNLFKNDAATAFLVVALVVLALAGALALAAFRKTEFYRSYKDRIDLAEAAAVNFIFLAAFGTVDLTEWEAKSAARVEAGLPAIDPRMLYVVDRLETYVNGKLGLHLEFDDILALAERKFQELKNDENSPVG